MREEETVYREAWGWLFKQQNGLFIVRPIHDYVFMLMVASTVIYLSIPYLTTSKTIFDSMTLSLSLFVCRFSSFDVVQLQYMRIELASQ